MMKPETIKKINQCKALQGMTVADLCATARFRDNLAAYWTVQKEDRKAIQESYKAMHKLGGAKGYKLPAHTIDRIFNLTVDDLVQAYKEIINGHCDRPFSERRYIGQLGQQAYSLTVAQYVIDEFPELEDELIPKTSAN